MTVAPRITRSDVETFVRDNVFDGYQEVSLPFGLSVPGKNKSVVPDLVFRGDISGKSILDVGCYYGFYIHEALKRGASYATGIELDSSRAAIARQAAALRGETVTIYEGDLMTAPVTDKADIVIFLSVLHHVADPIAVVRRLAELSKDEVVIEFCLPEHHIRRKLSSRSSQQKLADWFSDWRRRMGLYLMGRSRSMIAVGNVEYHRLFYFSREAFRNVFLVHNKIFREIEFTDAAWRKHRVIAHCKVY